MGLFMDETNLKAGCPTPPAGTGGVDLTLASPIYRTMLNPVMKFGEMMMVSLQTVQAPPPLIWTSRRRSGKSIFLGVLLLMGCIAAQHQYCAGIASGHCDFTFRESRGALPLPTIVAKRCCWSTQRHNALTANMPLQDLWEPM